MKIVALQPGMIAWLPTNHQQGEESNTTNYYLQAMGTVSHGRCMVAMQDSRLVNDNICDWIWNETRRIKRDLQARIARGEAYTKTIELVTGQIDQTNRMGPVALELIDYGTMETSTSSEQGGTTSVKLGHRFDQCPHMSMVMHWEEHVGLKLEAQIGQKQGRRSTMAWLAKCHEVLELMAM